MQSLKHNKTESYYVTLTDLKLASKTRLTSNSEIQQLLPPECCATTLRFFFKKVAFFPVLKMKFGVSPTC